MGDERFTAETGAHDAVLRAICARCPVRQECGDYARAARHNGGAWGFYAGLVRRSQSQMRSPRARPSNTVRG
ncbi:WhiB family transcriptional regulator [Microbacterium sp. NPDC090218]